MWKGEFTQKSFLNNNNDLRIQVSRSPKMPKWNEEINLDPAQSSVCLFMLIEDC